MLGFFLTELKKYIVSDLSEIAWNEVLAKAGLGSKQYLNGINYPDQELVKIVVNAADLNGMPVGHVLKNFGRFVGRDLFSAYRPLIDPKWKTLDFLENVEETIHKVVRARNRQAEPPRLTINRVASKEVVIEYRSPRKLCQLAQGIVLGVADHYQEPIQLVDETCMHRGDPICKIWVALKGEGEKDGEEDLWNESQAGPGSARNT